MSHVSPNESFSHEPNEIEYQSAPKRPARESLVFSQIAKTPRLSEYDSYTRLWQIIDKRMSKHNDTICEKIDEKIRESEKRIVDIFEKKFDEIRKDLNDITKRVDALETVSSEVIVIAKEVNNLKSVSHDVSVLKREIDQLKIELDKHENATVACDIRMNGVPYVDNEDLPRMFHNMCESLQINTPPVKSIFRLRYTRSGRNNVDPTIIVKFATPYQRNLILKSISNFIRRQKEPLKLYILGFDANVPFYVNENLTPLTYGIFLQALRLKRDKLIDAVYTKRGKVNIKPQNSDEFRQVSSIEDIKKFIHPSDENISKN